MAIIFGGTLLVISLVLGAMLGIAVSRDEAAVDMQKELENREKELRLSRDKFSRILYEENDVWFCKIEELPSCNSRGDTPEEALKISRYYVQKYLDMEESKL